MKHCLDLEDYTLIYTKLIKKSISPEVKLIVQMHINNVSECDSSSMLMTITLNSVHETEVANITYYQTPTKCGN